jgi:hypothetical protein
MTSIRVFRAMKRVPLAPQSPIHAFELEEGADLAEIVAHPESVEPSALWTGGNRFEGEVGLQRSLILRCNRHVLQLLASTTDRVEVALRELGTGGGIDVAALFRDATGISRVLYVDCKDLKPARSADLKSSFQQAKRLVLGARGSISLDTGAAEKVVLLRGYSGVTTALVPLQESKIGCEIELWGLLSVLLGGERRLIVGKWADLDESPVRDFPQALQKRPVADEKQLTPQSHPQDDALKVELAGAFVVGSLRLRAEDHRTGVATQPQAGLGPWLYRDEHNEKGVVRLYWMKPWEPGDSLESLVEDLGERLRISRSPSTPDQR